MHWQREENERLEELVRAGEDWLVVRARGEDTEEVEGAIKDAMRAFRRAERKRRREEKKVDKLA